jgi:hypothetical protein
MELRLLYNHDNKMNKNKLTNGKAYLIVIMFWLAVFYSATLIKPYL